LTSSALVIADTFLMLNGHELTSSSGDNVVTMLGLADGTSPEAELVEWFRENVAPL
jgi:prophage maintenance system killer protein